MDAVDILRQCVACAKETGGTLEDAVDATDFILEAVEVADISLAMNNDAKPRPWIDEFGLEHDASGIALSNDSNERRDQTWTDQYGITHHTSVPLSHEEQALRNRQRERDRKRDDRKRMLSTLAVLDDACSKMNATGAALAILDRVE